MLDTLTNAGADFLFAPTLAAAVTLLETHTTPEDLVLLLGAQGMDRAAELLLAALEPAVPRSVQMPGTAG